LSSTSDPILSAPVPTEILVVRHADVHNPKDILYGRLPGYRLSDKGRAQAEETAKFIAARSVTAIYTSPLLRARQTAHILTHYHSSLSVRVSSRLLEVKTAYQGSPNAIITRGFSFYEPRKDPGDESMAEVFDRLLRFLRQAVRRHAGGTVVAVTHADPIAIMRVGLEGLPLTAASLHATVYPNRASVNQITLEPDGRPGLSYFDVALAAKL